MALYDFPTTGLVPNVTTHSIGERTWVWTGVGWEISSPVPTSAFITRDELANTLKNINGAYLTEIRMIAPNFPTPVGWVDISYSQPSFHPVAGMAPEFVTGYYCGDDHNATADFGFRCENIDGTGRSPTGAYIALEPAANRFYRVMDDTGERDPFMLHEDQIQRFSGSTAADNISTSSVLGVNSGTTTNGIIRTVAIGAGGTGGASYQRGTIEINTDFDPSLRAGDETVPKHIDKKFIMKVYDGAVSDPALVDWQEWLNKWTEFSSSKLDKADDDNRSVTLYPNGGTAEAPANVSINQRIVMDNPYPGYYVHCEVEMYANGIWGGINFDIDISGNQYYSDGVSASLVDGKIYLQSGSLVLVRNLANRAWNPWGLAAEVEVSSAPCRIIVTRLGKVNP